MDSTRIRYLDYCKGIAIVLVVAGHYFPAQSPDSWRTLREIIYTFHMPMFFFVSGFFFFSELARGHRLSATLRKKAVRLLIPFVTIAVLFFLIKFGASFFFSLEHGVNARSIVNALVSPVNSYVPLIWFMQALFIMFVLFGFLRVFCGVPATVIFALCVGLSFIRTTTYLSLDRVFANMQFFCLGYLANQFSLVERIGMRRLLAALPLFAVNAAYFAGHLDCDGSRLVSGYLGIASVVFLAQAMSQTDSALTGLVEKAGLYSMGIYLLHAFFESAVRVFYYQVLKLPPSWFWLGFAAGVVAGIVPSAVIEAHVLRRYGATRKYILGLAR